MTPSATPVSARPATNLVNSQSLMLNISWHGLKRPAWPDHEATTAMSVNRMSSNACFLFKFPANSQRAALSGLRESTQNGETGFSTCTSFITDKYSLKSVKMSADTTIWNYMNATEHVSKKRKPHADLRKQHNSWKTSIDTLQKRALVKIMWKYLLNACKLLLLTQKTSSPAKPFGLAPPKQLQAGVEI